MSSRRVIGRDLLSIDAEPQPQNQAPRKGPCVRRLGRRPHRGARQVTAAASARSRGHPEPEHFARRLPNRCRKIAVSTAPWSGRSASGAQHGDGGAGALPRPRTSAHPVVGRLEQAEAIQQTAIRQPMSIGPGAGGSIARLRARRRTRPGPMAQSTAVEIRSRARRSDAMTPTAAGQARQQQGRSPDRVQGVPTGKAGDEGQIGAVNRGDRGRDRQGETDCQQGDRHQRARAGQSAHHRKAPTSRQTTVSHPAQQRGAVRVSISIAAEHKAKGQAFSDARDPVEPPLGGCVQRQGLPARCKCARPSRGCWITNNIDRARAPRMPEAPSRHDRRRARPPSR